MRFTICGQEMDVEGCTTKGRRAENQDCFSWAAVSGGRMDMCLNGESLVTADADRPDMLFAVVCDGLGGLADGKAASRTVTEDLMRWFATKGPDDDVRGSLGKAIAESDAWLGIRHPGSGTTLSAVLGTEGGWISAHIGDSRCYRVSGEETWRTRDQSPVEDLFRSGAISEDEMNTHWQRNVMDCCMGMGKASRTVFDDLGEDWERLVVCSDGAFGYMPVEEFHGMMRKVPSAMDMVDAIYSRGSTDNITVVIIDRARRAY